MDWLHCNLCFLQPGNGLKFFLTSCGHIYCANCVNAGTKDKCKMCAAKCSTIPLTGKLKADVEVFFTDPMDLLKKYQKQVTQVFDFQKNHRKRLMSHIRDKLLKQDEHARKTEKYGMSIQNLEREIIKLREENSYLKRLISEKGLGSHSRQGTPAKLSSPVHRASPGISPLPYLNRINSALQLQFGSQVGGNTPPCSIAPGRVSVRTPPCSGRIGTTRATPVHMDTQQNTPLSVPHPINFATPSPSRPGIR
ncbi:probable E3 SUMO-protein ligase RNF212 [Gigantopelta aegis]|uniref:probable E3 SUMO-protein ligase RNF212 n=1 Tax=Gigantopelta aegis TaxID=1735272 RepID=UPI001B88D678|nr:probable E3 SUMO-protein ligase RNF212 [Gigantopelta aegis]